MNIPDTFGLRRNGANKQNPDPMPMPRVVRPPRVADLRIDPVAAVEAALQQDLRPIPNPTDSVVQSFLDLGKNIAQAMREAGDHAEAQGKRRKEEYYRAADVAERKAEFQAREAGEFIDSIRVAAEAVAPKQMVVTAEAAATLPSKEELSAAYKDMDEKMKAAVIAQTGEQPEPPKAA